MIYKNGSNVKAFKGDHAPVNLYKGGTKIAGWEYSEVSGETLNMEGTYNDTCSLTINGGSEQAGTPSPDYPLPIQSTGNFDLTTRDNVEFSDVHYFPYTLRSLPGGVCDKIVIDNELETAELYKDVDNLILTAADAYYIYANGTNNNYTTFYRFITGSKTGVQNSICSHFPRVNFGWDNPTSERFSDHYSTTAKYFSIKNTTIGVLGTDDNETRIAKWKNWLSDNPVTFQYQLMAPVITELDYRAVRTFYPHTNIFTNAEIKPTLEGKFRVMEGE